MEKYRKNLEMKNELNDIKNYRNVELDKVKIPFKIMEENKNVEKMKFLHNKIKSELIFNEKKEIERLTKEFTFNNYRNNYNVSFEVIISALCGEERKDEEITYFTKLEKEFKEGQKIIKFYSTFENEKNTNKNKI